MTSLKKLTTSGCAKSTYNYVWLQIDKPKTKNRASLQHAD